MSIKQLLLKGARNGLGLIIVFFDWVSRPKGVQRSEAEQVAAQATMKGLSLYQFFACPFCTKTRRAIHALNVVVEPRDINKNPEHRHALEEGGGRVKVPCLRIEENGEVRWMYESNEIVRFLESRVRGSVSTQSNV
jgi:glutaredoxin